MGLFLQIQLSDYFFPIILHILVVSSPRNLNAAFFLLLLNDLNQFSILSLKGHFWLFPYYFVVMWQCVWMNENRHHRSRLISGGNNKCESISVLSTNNRWIVKKITKRKAQTVCAESNLVLNSEEKFLKKFRCPFSKTRKFYCQIWKDLFCFFFGLFKVLVKLLKRILMMVSRTEKLLKITPKEKMCLISTVNAFIHKPRFG